MINSDFPLLNSYDLSHQTYLEKQNRSWPQIAGAKNYVHRGMELKYVEPKYQGQVRMTMEDVGNSMSKWKHKVVENTLGSFSLYMIVKNFMEKKWKECGNIKVISLRNGVYLFRFQTKDDKVKILDQAYGHWQVKCYFLNLGLLI